MAMMGANQNEQFYEGVREGLALARKFVMAAPTSSGGPLGQRHTGGTGTFPRVADRAVDPDGSPDLVYSTYALRDALLWWIDRAIVENGGEE